MSTLISMVGQQPAAVATTTKTLKEQADLKQIFLLPTEKTTSEYSRLELYLRNDLGFPAEKAIPSVPPPPNAEDERKLQEHVEAAKRKLRTM